MAKPGDLDSGFGNGGKTTIAFGGTAIAFGGARQPDGKMVVVGSTSTGASRDMFAVARLNPDGSPDAAFGVSGKTTVDFGGGDTGFAVAVQPDGKIIVAGLDSAASGVAGFALARLNSDGSLDPSFGTGGKSIITFGASGGGAAAVLLQSDGRIIVVGDTLTAASQHDFTAVRLNPDGSVDTSYGTGGHTIVDFGGDDLAHTAALQPDGKLLLAGVSTSGSGGHNFAAARLNPNGSVDSTFGSGGMTTIDFGGDDAASAVLAQPDGKVVLAGDTTNGAGGGDLAVARLGSDGGPDASFGTGGKTTIDFGGKDLGRAAALQSDGRIIIAGRAVSAGGEDFAVARLNPTGALDASFGAGGKTTVDFGGDDIARAVALQPDGKVVLAGTGGTSGFAFAIARLSGGGGGGGGGGTPGPLPPSNASPCRAGVLALVHGKWSCVRVSGVDDNLLPGASDLPGYRAAGSGSGAARAALGDPVSRTLRRAQTQGAAFRVGSRGLSLGVFSFPTSGRAASALRALAHGRRRVSLGKDVGGLLRVRSTRRVTDVAVTFQIGRAIGTVRLRSRGRLAGSTAAVLAYAQEAAARMRRVLALTAWQRTVDGIGPDGSITPQLALQAFAISYGPLPGVRRPAGPAGAPPSGTAAMLMVARVWDRLSAAQHAAINRALGARHDASSPQLARSAANPVLTPDSHFQDLADTYNKIYRDKLSNPPPVTVKVFKASAPLPRDALADSLPVDANGFWRGRGGPVAYCRVRIAPQTSSEKAPYQNHVIAHELFHCYQFALARNWPDIKDWIMDGLAEWAADTVTGFDIDWMKGYLTTPTAPLFSRAYSGIGFWGHASEVGGNGSLWAKIPGILRTRGNAAAYAAAGGTGSRFVDTWASAAWRFGEAGPPWNQTDPVELAANDPALPSDPVTSSSQLASQPYALREYLVVKDPSAPLVNVIGGAGTVRAGTSRADLGRVRNDWFCFGKCECPPDENSSAIPMHRTADPLLLLALTGGASAGAGRIVYHSLDEYCKAKPKQPGGGGGGGGGQGLQVRGLTSGSPLLGTITSGSCSFGKGFRATGSGSGYRFEMRISGARGPGQFTIPNNDSGTYVNLSAGGGKTYSTQGRNTQVLGTTGMRDAGLAVIRTRRVRIGKRTVVGYVIAVGIDDLVSGGHPGVALIPAPGGLKC